MYRPKCVVISPLNYFNVVCLCFRFLLLVERHFKNVQFGHSFDVVADTVPAMLQSLRLIWTISRGYNKDERMGPLLQKIAWALYDRVIRVMDIPTLFR